MSLHIATRTFRSRRDEPLPDAAADEPEDGLEAHCEALHVKQTNAHMSRGRVKKNSMI